MSNLCTTISKVRAEIGKRLKSRTLLDDRPLFYRSIVKSLNERLNKVRQGCL